MRSFIELFTAARAVGTPTVVVKTFDSQSGIKAIKESLGEEYAETPLMVWDSLHGLRGIHELGSKAVHSACTAAGVEVITTVDLAPAALLALEEVPEDSITFIQNAHLYWESAQVIQGVVNLRDIYKNKGAMIVLFTTPGDVLPTELQQDTLVLEQELPTRQKLAEVIKQVFSDSADAKKEYKACKDAATAEVLEQCTDALVGLPEFPSEQAGSMSLNKLTGKMDFEELWGRKRAIISQMPGLSFHTGKETLADMYGNVEFAKYAKRFMQGKYKPSLVVRMDEIEKQFAGNATDSSGDKGNLLGQWLTWVNDNKVVCTLLVGVPGSSKSWSVYCVAGEYNKPCINYSISGIQDKHVGQSAKYQTNAHRTLDAISGGRIWLIATANSLNGLPPELISRFQVGGIWFADAPEDEERKGIMKLKIAKYGLDAKQPLPEMKGWTGRDVDNCAIKADSLGISLVEAGQYIIPLMQSHAEEMRALRLSAHDRFLSVNTPGTYQYSEPAVIPTVATAPSTVSRKIR